MQVDMIHTYIVRLTHPPPKPWHAAHWDRQHHNRGWGLGDRHQKAEFALKEVVEA